MSRSVLLFQLLLVGAVIAGAAFTRHGLLDLRKFSNQIAIARVRVAGVEEENKRLKLQVDLFSHATDRITESQIRSFLGWARSDEVVYLEKSK